MKLANFDHQFNTHWSQIEACNVLVSLFLGPREDAWWTLGIPLALWDSWNGLKPGNLNVLNWQYVYILHLQPAVQNMQDKFCNPGALNISLPWKLISSTWPYFIWARHAHFSFIKYFPRSLHFTLCNVLPTNTPPPHIQYSQSTERSRKINRLDQTE